MTSAAPQLTRLLAFRLTVRKPEWLVRFYTDGIGCALGDVSAIPPSEMASLGLGGGGVRRTLSLGEQCIQLDTFANPGAGYPTDRNAADIVFQHFAIVVADAAEAYRRALQNGAIPISEGGPVKLPPSAGGVTAVKFRDPEGHPLEFLQFPAGGGGRWRKAAISHGPLGIDHSAISVSNADASALFYTDLGLREADRTLNRGVTQTALDGLENVQVDVVPMVSGHGGPHLELLGYRDPVGRSTRWKPNDVAATRIAWQGNEDGLIADLDGHFHQVSR